MVYLNIRTFAGIAVASAILFDCSVWPQRFEEKVLANVGPSEEERMGAIVEQLGNWPWIK